mgnify:CR=1 FL=1
MADFTTSRATNRANFTDRVGREIVMQHEAVFVLAHQRIDDLLVYKRVDLYTNLGRFACAVVLNLAVVVLDNGAGWLSPRCDRHASSGRADGIDAKAIEWELLNTYGVELLPQPSESGSLLHTHRTTD